MAADLAAFLIVSIVVIVTPGQDTALTIGNTLFGGRRSVVVSSGTAARLGARTAFRQGVLSNLGNPKMAVFFTSLLPQFGGSFPALLALGVLFCSLTLVWLTAYAVAVARAGGVLRRPAVRRTLEGLTGAVLVALGLRLATESR
jgi:threonine/homoserine/homoserine lactone efflux protein